MQKNRGPQNRSLGLFRSLLLNSSAQLTHDPADIRKIECLADCCNLQELNLSGNDITKIEGLERLHHLRKLILTTNKIESLQGIEVGIFSPLLVHEVAKKSSQIFSLPIPNPDVLDCKPL